MVQDIMFPTGRKDHHVSDMRQLFWDFVCFLMGR